jgi:hypothetical protein
MPGDVTSHVSRAGAWRGGRALGALAIAVGAALLASSSMSALAQPRQLQAAQGDGKVAYTRLYSGPDGVSHFAREELILALRPGGQGLEALAVNRIGDVKGVTFAQLKAGATEDWHVAPQRILMVCVRGIAEITAGDGQKRRLTPGEFMLLEDTTGKGHITHALGTEDHVALAIPVEEGVPARPAAAPAAGSR